MKSPGMQVLMLKLQCRPPSFEFKFSLIPFSEKTKSISLILTVKYRDALSVLYWIFA